MWPSKTQYRHQISLQIIAGELTATTHTLSTHRNGLVTTYCIFQKKMFTFVTCDYGIIYYYKNSFWSVNTLDVWKKIDTCSILVYSNFG